jgi:methionyl aminopeptidase
MSETDKTDKAKEALEKYRLAGKISIEAKELAKTIVKPGKNSFEIAQEIESFIRSKGAKPAFPVNFSINNEAAHYSPEILDTRVVGDSDIIKLDLGAHVDGYIVDTAITINFNNEFDDLTQISKIALDNVLEILKPGVSVADVGRIIEDTIVNSGYEPVRNLSGHQIKKYNLHAGISVPNHGPGHFGIPKHKFKAGEVFAIEPFASNGVGEIKNGKRTNIFRVIKKPKTSEDAVLLSKYFDKIGILPFSPRFVFEDKLGENGKNEITKDIRKLLRKGIIMGYPVLVEVDPNAVVSQHEHTVLITKNGCEILTKEN